MTGQDTCVIYNPTAGRGRASKRLKLLRGALGGAEFRATSAPGHGEELAFEAVKAGFGTLGAAGGDGTVHEVANGLLRASRPETSLAVFPLGSANDYAYSLGLAADWWLTPGADGTRPVDVGVVRDPSGRQRHFVNGLGLGFNGAVTLEARRIRFLRGVPLYLLALVRTMRTRFASPPMRLTFDGELLQLPTLALTVAIGRREGNFILAPHAEVDDGLFDYLHAANLTRRRLIRYVPRMITGNLPTDDPGIRTGRCRAVRVESATPLVIHVDGEFFCRPEEGICGVEVEMLPGALRVCGPRTAR